ncbi:MAG: hypothetical protein ACE5H0_13900, partial [Bacteroidota bacterium]
FAEGSGSLGSAALSEETTEVVKGTSSLKIVLGAKSYLRSGVQHDYGAGTEADWSGKEFICVYLYGINDGGTIRVDSFMPDGANQRYIEFTDNFSGWGRFVIPFNKMTSIGSPNPSTVRNIRVTYTTTGTRYIDRMVVDVGNWITIEGLVPDTLLQGSGSAFRWKLSSWDESAGDFHTNPFATLFDNGNPGGSGWIYLEFLDETLSSNIWSGQAEAYTIFPEGERGEAKDKLYGNVSSIIYSLYYGTLNRIGFAVKMPPSTESDDLTGSNAINKVKLKLEVYYAGTPDGVTTVNELLRLDALRNVKAGAFIRDPKKARNLIIVKGDKFTYNVPPDPDEWTREPAPTVIYDDDESFWSPSQVGTGSLAAPTLSEETGIVAKNGSSLKLTAGGAGTRQWVGCKHEYATYPDWSGFNFVGIHVYGVNDSATLRLKIKLAGQNYNCDFATDNFTGWKFFVVPFKDFSGTDKDWSRVQSIRVLRDTDATWYIDYMVVGVKRYFWGAKWCTLTNDPDAKVGIYSLKAQLDVGVLNNFYRLSSGLIEHDDFTTNWDTGFWEEEGQGAGGDIYDAYVQGDELVCKIKEVANAKEAHAGVVSKSKIDLTKGYVFEVKVIPDVQGSPPRGNRHEHAELRLTKSGDKTKDPELEENAPGIQFGAVINSDHFNWYSYEHWWESGQFKTEPLWSGKN